MTLKLAEGEFTVIDERLELATIDGRGRGLDIAEN
jgi:hypothetical protein